MTEALASEAMGWVFVVGLTLLVFAAAAWFGLLAWDEWQVIRGTKRIRR